MKKRLGQTIVELVKGDITDMNTNAIVNASNSQLAHGGGIAAAITAKGGQTIQEESDVWIFARGEVNVGEVAVTSAGLLPCKYVIHAIGPRMGDGDEDAKLESATMNTLCLADKHSLKSIAFPAISTGIFGYPVDRCARVMLHTVHDYLKDKTKLERIIFCLIDDAVYTVFCREFQTIK